MVRAFDSRWLKWNASSFRLESKSSQPSATVALSKHTSAQGPVGTRNVVGKPALLLGALVHQSWR
jgi:hypothetical protein